jgi:hypothetical protein
MWRIFNSGFNPYKGEVNQRSITNNVSESSNNSNSAKDGMSESSSIIGKIGGGSASLEGDSAKSGILERSVNKSSPNLIPMKGILKKPSCKNDFCEKFKPIDIFIYINPSISFSAENTCHGMLFDEDFCSNCNDTGKQCQDCLEHSNNIRCRGFKNTFSYDKSNPELDPTLWCSECDKWIGDGNNRSCYTCVNMRQPILNGDKTIKIELRRYRKTTTIRKPLSVAVYDERIIKKRKVFKIFSKRPEGYIEYVIFFKFGDNDVSLRFFSMEKLSKEDIKDALEFFNTHPVNSFYTILYVSDKIEFKPKLTFDEVEKYSKCKFLPEYENLHVKRFDILGVVSNFRIGDLHESNAALFELSRKSSELLQLNEEKMGYGNRKQSMVNLCDAYDSSSSSCSIHTFFHLFIYSLTLMMMYVTMIDTTKNRVHIRPTKKRSEDNTGENRDAE